MFTELRGPTLASSWNLSPRNSKETDSSAELGNFFLVGWVVTIFLPNLRALIEPVSPQAAHLGFHFYCFHDIQLEMDLLEGPD